VVPDVISADASDLDRPVVVLSVAQAKGLEFDAVLVADPQRIMADSPRGLNDLYVAITRATQRLGVVHECELPKVLSPPAAPGRGRPYLRPMVGSGAR
jgi:DNA helicase IV